MKKFTFILAGLALLASAAFTSCEKTPAPSADEGTKSIALSINFGGVGTKTEVTPDDPWENSYKGYESLDLYFTSSTGSILYYYHSTSTDAEGSNGKIIWDGLNTTTSNPNSGVYFVGMENVNRVYVVANGPQITSLTTEDNGKVTSSNDIAELNALIKLESYKADNDQNKMLYAGATFSLDPIEGTAVKTNQEITVGDEGAINFKAEITIRPAVSRLEIGEVAVQTAGDIYFKADANGNYVATTSTDPDALYKVSYSGFTPSLVGVYMSNVYRTSPLFPQQTALSTDLFATPSEVAAIVAGNWVSLNSEQPFRDCLQYANYSGSAYSDLVGDTYRDQAASNDELRVFKGDNDGDNDVDKVIPFNFFVPYDITSTANATDITAVSGAAVPVLHFQFKEPDVPMTVGPDVYEKGSTGAWDVEVTDPQTVLDVTAEVNWPAGTVNSEDGIAYANVVKYYTSDDMNTEVTLKPGYIYKVQQVLVSPVNLEITSQKINSYNVYVVVTVVPYATQNVYPGFE